VVDDANDSGGDSCTSDDANDSGGDSCTSDISEGPFSRSDVIRQIQDLYRKYNPAKLDELPDLVETYDLHTLYAQIKAKYEGTQDHRVIEKKMEHRQSAFRGNGKVSPDGVARAAAKQQRISFKDRASRNFKGATHVPSQDQSVGDQAALLLTSFHSALSPYLVERCWVHPETGHHVRSITNKKRFVGDNVKYCVKQFEKVAEYYSLGTAEDGCWFMINHVNAVVGLLIAEAMRQEHGKWQWRGFWMHQWEVDASTHQIICAHLAGVAWDG